MSGRLSDSERAAAGLAAGGLVIGGARVPVPGVELVTWLDDPKRAPRVTDGHSRAHPPTAIVLHTTRGTLGGLREGSRASTQAENLALYQSRTTRDVSWHLTIDTDGTVLQQADLRDWVCWQAGHVNDFSIGIELVQHSDSYDLWTAQLVALVAVVEAACAALSIPRRVPVLVDGAPRLTAVVPWRSAPAGGKSVRWPGVIGHVHVASPTGPGARGPGDPGPHPFRALLAAGFEGVAV